MLLPAALTLALLTAPAQALPDPVITPAPDPTTAIAFVTDQDRMTLPVTIADAGPYPFVVDTGAQRTVISRELAQALKLRSGRFVTMTAMTGTSKVATALIPSITVGGLGGILGGTGIEAPALAAAHLGADGLLGLDTLQGRALTIDFDRDRMTVAAATRRKRARRAASDEIVITARSVLGQLVVTDAFYAGLKVRVILDTGSAASIGNLALRRRVRGAKTPVAMMSVTGAMLQADAMQVPALRVGSVTFGNLPVAFADAAPFARFGLLKRPALMLGMDALRLFRRVEIDFSNREVRFALPKGTPRN